MHSLQEKSMTQCSVFKNKWFFLPGRPMPDGRGGGRKRARMARELRVAPRMYRQLALKKLAVPDLNGPRDEAIAPNVVGSLWLRFT